MEYNNTTKLLELIKKSKRILIASHTGPDPDAIFSTVFTKEILKINFKNKNINANIEGVELAPIKKLINEDSISNVKFAEAIKKFTPDLLIVQDMNDLKLLSRESILDILKRYFASKKIVLIDHHKKPEYLEMVNYYYNFNDNSCAETVYKIFIDILKQTAYSYYYNHILLGIIGDTGSFGYLKKDSDFKSTFDITAKLINEGGNIDELRTELSRISEKQLLIHKEFLKNLTYKNEYTYTYISDKFFRANMDLSDADYSTANKQFVQNYLKTIGNAYWGFAIKPLNLGTYTLSFRAPIGMLDLTIFTKQFNGGGHKAAAGGIIQAKSDKEAIRQVIDVIEKYKRQAYANK